MNDPKALDYESIKKHCERQSIESTRVIDKWLLDYNAGRDKSDRLFNKQLRLYKSYFSGLQPELINSMRAQFMYHCIFKHDGKIKNYLKQSEVKQLPESDFEYLKQLSKYPSQFVFSVIKEKPAPDFFVMADILTEEELLVYSPGISRTLKDRPNVLTWFTQLHFNGECYQSYGPNSYFLSLFPSDILYVTMYLTETDFSVSLDMLIQEDPFPFLSLCKFSELPVIIHEDDLICSCITEIDMSNKTLLKPLHNHFELQTKEGVTRYTHPEWSGFPHFARLYYDSSLKVLHLTTQTERSYKHFADILRKHNIQIGEFPNERFTPTAQLILNEMMDEDFASDSYEFLFEEDESFSPEQDEGLETVNSFLNDIIPMVNANKTIRLKALADQYDLSIEDARGIIKSLETSLGKKIKLK